MTGLNGRELLEPALPARRAGTVKGYLRGIERRVEAGLNPVVGSVASIFISRWDVAVTDKVPMALRNQLGIAIAGRTYRAYRDEQSSGRLAAGYAASLHHTPGLNRPGPAGVGRGGLPGSQL